MNRCACGYEWDPGVSAHRYCVLRMKDPKDDRIAELEKALREIAGLPIAASYQGSDVTLKTAAEIANRVL